ncbi:hypothetical protein EBZ80_06800 [bacterium]|nr:hypothetical protein [bacterium]
MKSKIPSLIAAASLSSGIAGSAGAQDPGHREIADLVPVEAIDLFVPNGFDSNDEIVVVIDGYLPNSCYRLTRPELSVDHDKHEIKITQMARKFPGPCLVPLVPFTNIVQIGALEQGTYRVTTNKGLLAATLGVAEDTSSGNYGPDDFLYAPVDSVSVSKNTDGRYEARLAGRFTNDCMEFDEVRVLHKGRVIELLPILKDHATDSTCQPVEKAFTKKVLMPVELSAGRNLVHIRSLNGASVNSVFSVSPSFQP